MFLPVIRTAAPMLLAAGLVIPSFAAITPEDLRGNTLPPDAVWLESIDLSQAHQEFGRPQAGKSVDGLPITINGNVFPRGVGAHAHFEMSVDLKKQAARFFAMVGVDDEKKPDGSVVFRVDVDGKTVKQTDVLRQGDDPRWIEVDLTGARKMTLFVLDGGDGINCDHADWGGAMILMKPGTKAKPTAFLPEPTKPPVLATTDNRKTSINYPRITGVSPNKPFLFRVPASGQAPLTFSAKGLPSGLVLDSQTGIITGKMAVAARHEVEVTASGPGGKDSQQLTIVCGENALALTPPMGWNSWNVWACAVDDAKVRAAADMMVSSGLASHGYQYINIDDCWQAGRDANGEIVPNEKFPDMKALADYVHSKGLKLGIYSSPGPKTCAGYTASYQYEEQDAKTYAKWGIDYLKYDWCSYGGISKGDTRDELMKPYLVMQKALAGIDRDIVYSLCQYGMGKVWEWGESVGGNCWRTTGDITDTWTSMKNIGFSQDECAPFAGPGHWNDPDMLVVGHVGWGPNLHPTRLTPHEQVTHITLWSLLSSPLLTGCDLTKLDKFTLSLLTNDEVLAVNQDPLGKTARLTKRDGETDIWSRPLADGSVAVGLFNKDYTPKKITVQWKDLGLAGEQAVRDLWRKKNVGKFIDSFTAEVQPHGAVMLKVGR